MQAGGGPIALAELKFNGESIEARTGETLVEAGRRHGSHVWFLCDGRGICQTCECRVLSGASHLSRPSDLERTGLSKGRRQRGYRLGCQARLAGSGPVSVVSRAEELRRRAREALSGAGERTLWERLRTLGAETASATVDVASGVAIVAPYTIPQLIEYPPTPARIAGYVRDTMRLARTLWRSGAGPSP
jgi:ferredoxin